MSENRLRAGNLDEVIAAMSLEEKLAQLVGLWVQASEDGAEVAPLQHDMLGEGVPDVASFVADGLGQLTRPLGGRATDITDSRRTVAALQRAIVKRSRFAIPALVHEECLTGLQLYGATTYPAPLAWGATWNPRTRRRHGHPDRHVDAADRRAPRPRARPRRRT